MSRMIDYVTDLKTSTLAEAQAACALVAVRSPERAAAFVAATRRLSDPALHLHDSPSLDQLTTALNALLHMWQQPDTRHVAPDLDQPFVPMFGRKHPATSQQWLAEAAAFWVAEMYRHQVPDFRWQVDTKATPNDAFYHAPDQLQLPDAPGPVASLWCRLAPWIQEEWNSVEREVAVISDGLERYRRPVGPVVFALRELLPVSDDFGPAIHLSDEYRSCFEHDVDVDAEVIAAARAMPGVAHADIVDSDRLDLALVSGATVRAVQLALVEHAMTVGMLTSTEVDTTR